MEVSASPEGQKVAEAPGEVIARVGIHHLEETEDEEGPEGDEVEIGREDNRPNDGANAQDDGLSGVGILTNQAKRGLELVVLLVNVLVEGTIVKEAVTPVLPGVLNDEEGEALQGNLPERGQGECVLHSNDPRGLVKRHHHGELDEEVVEEKTPHAPLDQFRRGLLVLLRAREKQEDGLASRWKV